VSSVPYSDLLLPDDYRPDPESIEQIARAYQNANSRGLANSLIVKATTGLLFGFTAVSTNVAAQFIQLFDARTVPADTTVPLLSFPVAAANVAASVWVPGRAFVQGIVICNSTTQATKTTGAADTIFDAQFL
jgi:hypothetical protein